MFERSGALEVVRNPRRGEGVITDPGFYSSRPAPALDHTIRVGLRHAVRRAGCPPVVLNSGASFSPAMLAAGALSDAISKLMACQSLLSRERPRYAGDDWRAG